MAYIQYLVFNEKPLPLPDSYDIGLSDVEADSGGETEAGTTQRDVVRTGVADFLFLQWMFWILVHISHFLPLLYVKFQSRLCIWCRFICTAATFS